MGSCHIIQGTQPGALGWEPEGMGMGAEETEEGGDILYIYIHTLYTFISCMTDIYWSYDDLCCYTAENKQHCKANILQLKANEMNILTFTLLQPLLLTPIY